MSKLVRILIVTIMLSMFLTSTAFADPLPVGDCPPGFMLHMAHVHDEHHGDHLMAGTNADQNGDGYVCADHVTPSGKVHVHIDNNVMTGVYKH